jgi:hypothetical protein
VRITENNRRARCYMLTPAGERELAAERGEWERSSGAYGWKVGLPRTGSARRRHTGGKSELSGVIGRRLPLAPNGQEFLPTCVRVPSENDADAGFAGGTGRRRAPRCTLARVLLRLLRSHASTLGLPMPAVCPSEPLPRVRPHHPISQIGLDFTCAPACRTRHEEESENPDRQGLPCHDPQVLHSAPSPPLHSRITPGFSHLSQTGPLADSSCVVTDPDPQSL